MFFFVILDDCDPVSDFNIARHIVNVHQKKAAAYNELADFTKEQLQRYIKYARSKIKPVISEVSSKLLVKEYLKLRQADSGGNRSAYRMTVRQLESMIRLSEALARVHLDKEIKPHYVQEAARLLKKTRIHIESEPVDLSEFDRNLNLERNLNLDRSDNIENQEDKENEMAQSNTIQPKTPHSSTKKSAQKKKSQKGKDKDDDDYHANNDEEDQPLEKRTRKSGNIPSAKQEETHKNAVSIGFEDYRRIAHQLASHLKKLSDSSESDSGIKQKDLIDWYLNTQQDDMHSEEDLVKQYKMIRAIVNRLIQKDHILLVLDGDIENQDDRLLEVHPSWDPNFV